MSRIALGTVQFGLEYGVGNATGVVKETELVKVFSALKSLGIDTLDTAASYGDSEVVIGQFLKGDFDIVTKIPRVPESSSCSAFVFSSVRESLINLRRNSVHGVLLHDATQLTGFLGDELWSALQELKGKGIVKKIGISVYQPDELDEIVYRYKPDIVQCPINILDRSFEVSGWGKWLSENMVEVHARSVFLQGLLLSRQAQDKLWFQQWRGVFSALEEQSLANGQNVFESCLAYVASLNFVSKAVVGVQTYDELAQVCEVFEQKDLVVLEELEISDRCLLDPRTWQLS